MCSNLFLKAANVRHIPVYRLWKNLQVFTSVCLEWFIFCKMCFRVKCDVPLKVRLQLLRIRQTRFCRNILQPVYVSVALSAFPCTASHKTVMLLSLCTTLCIVHSNLLQWFILVIDRKQSTVVADKPVRRFCYTITLFKNFIFLWYEIIGILP